MGTIISTFPVLNKRLTDRIRFTTDGDYRFSYNDATNEVNMRTEEMGEGSLNHKIIDDTGMWNPDHYNLRIRRQFSFQNYICLFGKNGIACSNAVIGIAVIWMSYDSRQRGAIEIGELKSDGKPVTFKMNFPFNVAQLRGMVELRTVLYIKQAGTPNAEEMHLANTYGCLLGELEEYFQFEIDGNGSAFPIFEISKPGEPLWMISCDWENAAEDQFSDTVSISLNTAHKNYRYIDRKNSKFDAQLLSEIIASALTVMLQKLKQSPDEWEIAMEGGDKCAKGSVCEAVSYFCNVLHFDTTSPENMALSIRKYLDREVQI